MIAWASARYRWRTLLGSFIALALGIGLLAASMIVIASAGAQPDPRYRAADVLVAPEVVGETNTLADRRLPFSTSQAQRLVRELSAVDGVAEVVADRGFRVEVLRNGTQVSDASEDERLGHNWSSRLLGEERLVSGSAPRTSGEVVVPESYDVAVGEQVALSTPQGRTRAEVTGHSDGSAVYVSDAQAQRRSTGSPVIGLVLSADADTDTVVDQVDDIVSDRHDVLAGAERSALENEVDRSNRYVGAQLLTAMGALSAFVSIFVVATTFAFVVARRRHEIGLLRAIGATPRQIRRMLLGEALLIGVLASTAGALLGMATAPVLGGWMVDAGMQARGWEPRTVGWPVAGSVFVGVLVALAGVWAASRRASRTSPLSVLREAAVEPRAMTRTRWLAASVSVLAGVGFAYAAAIAESGAAAGYGIAAVAAFVTALTTAAPAYLGRMIRLVCPKRAVTGELVRAETMTNVGRMASLVAPVLVTVAFTVAITAMTETMDNAFTNQTRSQLPTERVLVPADETVGVSDRSLRSVRGSGGEVTAALPTGVVIDGRWQDAVGIEDPRIAAGTIALRPKLLEKYGWTRGERVRVTGADGRTTRLRVAAAEGLPADIVLARTDARAHDPAAITPVGYVDDGPADVRGAARIVTADSYESADDAEESQLLRLFVMILLGLSMGFSGLAIVNTMLMSTGERRRDFAILELAGGTVRQIVGFVAIEAAAVASIGAVLGIAVAWPAGYAIASGLRDDLGVEVSVSMDWSAVATIAGLCALIAVLASVAPVVMRSVVHRGEPATRR